MVQQKKVPSDKASEQPEFGIHVNLSHRVAGIYNPSPLCEMGGRETGKSVGSPHMKQACICIHSTAVTETVKDPNSKQGKRKENGSQKVVL